MGEGYSFKVLSEKILGLSKAPDWETAKKEWYLIDVWEADEPETCLCGHYPIIEVCTIGNRLTQNTADVGNCCVKRFLGFRSDKILNAIKKIRKDITKSLNSDAIVFFKEKGIINNWEYEFLYDTMKKRNLSDRQATKRININGKILRYAENVVLSRK